MCSKIAQITQSVTNRVAWAKEEEDEDGNPFVLPYAKLYKPEELSYIRKHGPLNGFDLYNPTYTRVVKTSERYIDALIPTVKQEIVKYTRHPEVNRDIIQVATTENDLAGAIASDLD